MIERKHWPVQHMLCLARGAVRPWKHRSLGLGNTTGIEIIAEHLEPLWLWRRARSTCRSGSVQQIRNSGRLGQPCCDHRNTRRQNTLHSSVEICYQNKFPSQTYSETSPAHPTLSGRTRTRFDGGREGYSSSLKRAQLHQAPPSEVMDIGRLRQNDVDFTFNKI